MIYLVTGFPRSGTSMLMQALEAGGLPVVRSRERDQFSAAHADAYYRPNPISLYEPSEKDMAEPGFPKQFDGMAVKVVAPMLRRIAVHDYRVAFMRRDPEEIRQSYRAGFGENAKVDGIERTVQEAEAFLLSRADVLDIVNLWYRDVVADPIHWLKHLRWPINVARAASVVRPDFVRFRLELLEVGI